MKIIWQTDPSGDNRCELILTLLLLLMLLSDFFENEGVIVDRTQYDASQKMDMKIVIYGMW